MSVSGDCGKCIKWLLFAFNFIFWLVGLAILSLGVWLYVDYGPFLNNIGGLKWISVPALIITAGVFVTAIAFVGFWGAIRENKTALLCFICLLLVAVFLYIAAGVLVALKKNDADEELSDLLYKSIRDYNTSDPIRKAWNFIQENFDCCGVNASSDWYNATWSGGFQKVPDSCCEIPETGCGLLSPEIGSYFTRGCYAKLKDALQSSMFPVGIAIVSLTSLQLIGIFFAWYLRSQIDRVEIL
eukprot:m.28897 g.28897  ORF g.28897 m.28897 type:complete len:242 (+) comp31092_c0_seq1:372-1097(+)